MRTLQTLLCSRLSACNFRDSRSPGRCSGLVCSRPLACRDWPTLHFGRLIKVSQKAQSAEISIAVGTAKQVHGIIAKTTQSRIAETPFKESATTTRFGYLSFPNQWLTSLAIKVSALRTFFAPLEILQNEGVRL